MGLGVSNLLDLLRFYGVLGVDFASLLDPSDLSEFSLPSVSNAASVQPSSLSTGFHSMSKLQIIARSENRTKGSDALRELENKTAEMIESIFSVDELIAFVNDFDACDVKKMAKNTVFSDGVSFAKVMLIGEAPGENEDKLGIPFCGKSGKLLDVALATINLTRSSNIYITNSFFWRPPANRKPTDEEIAICRPILQKHISLINPDLIILCGATAMEAVLMRSGITKFVGSFDSYINKYMTKSVAITAIFHPAYLLRNPLAKKDMWLSLLKIRTKMDSLGIE